MQLIGNCKNSGKKRLTNFLKRNFCFNHTRNRIHVPFSAEKDFILESISKMWIRVQGKARSGSKGVFPSIHGSM
jgi:hypothetical protein